MNPPQTFWGRMHFLLLCTVFFFSLYGIPKPTSILVIVLPLQFSCSVVSNSLRPHGLQHARLPCPSPVPQLAQTHVYWTHGHWVSNAIQPSHPLSSPSPPAFNLSQHQGHFKWVSSLHQVAKVLEFQRQHQSFQLISGLISFRMDWLDLFAVQGILKCLQHLNSKASILQCSAFRYSQLTTLQ